MISHATVLGRAHRLMQHNGQDFAATASPTPDLAIGLVCDGCGSKFVGNGRSHTLPQRNRRQPAGPVRPRLSQRTAARAAPTRRPGCPGSAAG